MLYSWALNYWWVSWMHKVNRNYQFRSKADVPWAFQAGLERQRRVTLTFEVVWWANYAESLFRFFHSLSAPACCHIVCMHLLPVNNSKFSCKLWTFPPTRSASTMTQKGIANFFAPLPGAERDKKRFRSRILIKYGMKWFITLRETIPLKAPFHASQYL